MKKSILKTEIDEDVFDPKSKNVKGFMKIKDLNKDKESIKYRF